MCLGLFNVPGQAAEGPIAVSHSRVRFLRNHQLLSTFCNVPASNCKGLFVDSYSCLVFNFGHSGEYELVSHGGFELHLMDDGWCSLAFCYQSFGHLHPLPIVQCSWLPLVEFSVLHVTWILDQMHEWRLLSSYSVDYLSSLESTLWCTKVFHFCQVKLILIFLCFCQNRVGIFVQI